MKQIKTDKGKMTPAKTLEGYKFAPLVIELLRRANPHEHEHVCLGLSSPDTSSFVWAYYTACRSPAALAFSAAIYFAMKRPALCFAVLRHSPSSWAAVVHWSALIAKALRSSKDTQSTLFLAPPRSPRPHQFFKHHALRQSRILHTRHKSREQDPPPAHNHHDALTSCLDK